MKQSSESSAVIFDTESAPVELSSVTTPAAIAEAVWPALVLMVAAPEELTATLTPLARSTAVSRSLTVAAGVPVVPR